MGDKCAMTHLVLSYDVLGFFNFNSEKRYDIQTENLESKYKVWQKKLHPDLVHSKSEVRACAL